MILELVTRGFELVTREFEPVTRVLLVHLTRKLSLISKFMALPSEKKITIHIMLNTSRSKGKEIWSVKIGELHLDRLSREKYFS